jgi:hypothetical protein
MDVPALFQMGKHFSCNFQKDLSLNQAFDNFWDLLAMSAMEAKDNPINITFLV